jgi:hypothetical protein
LFGNKQQLALDISKHNLLQVHREGALQIVVALDLELLVVYRRVVHLQNVHYTVPFLGLLDILRKCSLGHHFKRADRPHFEDLRVEEETHDFACRLGDVG